MYIVTGEDLAGSNAKIWRADFGSLTNCSSATLTQLVALKDLTTGRNPIISNASAIGIAAAPVAPLESPTIDQTFTSNDCSNPTKKFDFGGHAVTLTFLDCANTFPQNQTTTFSVTALETLPSNVNFNNSFPSPIEGMRYSPTKGLVVQYVIEKTGYNPFVNGPHPLRLIYQFFTQETIATPGVGKASSTVVTDPYTDIVGNDFWDAGVLDPPAGERGDTCCSKRVVFNTPTQNNNACTLSFGTPFQPGGVQNPQFNSGQTLTLNVNVQGGCTGGTLRVSIFQSVAGVFVPITVTSNVQEDNIMDANGPSSFKYGVNTDNLATGQYRVTVWGTVGAPISHDFAVQR
jgi:hypothetical protein